LSDGIAGRRSKIIDDTPQKKRHKGSSSSDGAAAGQQPASSAAVEDDEEHKLDGSEADDDEENDRFTQVAHAGISFDAPETLYKAEPRRSFFRRGFRSRSAPAPRIPSLGEARGRVS
jgi:hypothetical protein